MLTCRYLCIGLDVMSPFGRNAHDCLVYFDVSWRDIFSVELKKIA